jgi:hypothetical protein
VPSIGRTPMNEKDAPIRLARFLCFISVAIAITAAIPFARTTDDTKRIHLLPGQINAIDDMIVYPTNGERPVTPHERSDQRLLRNALRWF